VDGVYETEGCGEEEVREYWDVVFAGSISSCHVVLSFDASIVLQRHARSSH